MQWDHWVGPSACRSPRELWPPAGGTHQNVSNGEGSRKATSLVVGIWHSTWSMAWDAHALSQGAGYTSGSVDLSFLQCTSRKTGEATPIAGSLPATWKTQGLWPLALGLTTASCSRHSVEWTNRWKITFSLSPYEFFCIFLSLPFEINK